MIWSLTPFFNEVDVLEIRLAELDPVVDRFVIAEATRTYSGDRKRLFFHENMHRFLPWADKIEYVVVDDMPDGVREAWPRANFHPTNSDRWRRENHQRDALIRGCAGMSDDDLVLLSDVDEIPSRHTVAALDGQVDYEDIQRIHLPQHVMYLNWRWNEPTTIAVCRLTSGKMIRKLGPERVRKAERGRPYHDGTGWHLSYMGGAEAIRYKIQSAAHVELDDERWTDLGAIGERMSSGRDMFDRPERWCKWVPIEALPEHVRMHPDRFRHLMIERPR